MFDLLYASAVGDEATVVHCLQRAERTGFLWGDVARTCGRGRTALHYAVLGNHNHLLDPLLKAGAAVDAQDRDGFSAAMLAAGKNNYVALDRLIKAGAMLNLRAFDGSGALHRAAAAGHAWSVTLLLSAGCSASALDRAGNTPLFEACTNGHLGVAKLLVQAGAKVNTGSLQAKKQSALHAATAIGHVELVQYLLQNKAVASWADADGRTPLHVCAAASFSSRTASAMRSIAALLLAAPKVDVHARDAAGRSCYDVAHDSEIKQMIRDAINGILAPPRPPLATAAPTPTLPKAIITHPHPDIPGHRWADPVNKPAAGPGTPLATPWAQHQGTTPPAPPMLKQAASSGLTELNSAGASPQSDASSADEWRGAAAYQVTPPWALDGEYEDFSASIKRVPQLLHERIVWAASKAAPARPASALAHRSCAELQPSDKTWFDTSEGYLHKYPPRRAWGRYAS